MTRRAVAGTAVCAALCATLATVGIDPSTGTPEEFGRIVASDYAKWGPTVTASGFRPQ